MPKKRVGQDQNRVRYIYIVADPGWRDSRPTLGATLTTAVSGVYNAGWLSTGLGSRVFNRDTNVILNLASWGDRTPGYRPVLSETERSPPVCNHFWFYMPIERIVPRRDTN